MTFRVILSCLSAILMVVVIVRCESGKTDKYDQDADNEVSREKLESTIKQLMENLKKKNFYEDEMQHREKKSAAKKCPGLISEVHQTCGGGDLKRCKRALKPAPGHVCENFEPLEPKGPYCNCPLCNQQGDNRKVGREVNFEDLEASKSESAKLKTSNSIYKDKWNPSKNDDIAWSDKQRKKTPLQQSVEKLAAEDIPKRNLFSCKKTAPIYDIENEPISGDPEFQEQLKLITQEECPSLGILKYHEKVRSREVDEL